MNSIFSQTVNLHPRVRHRQVGDEGVVVCMHSGDVLVINQVGAHIVNKLRESSDVNDLLVSICEVFDVPQAQAQTDLIIYLHELSEQNVVVLQANDGVSA